MLGAAPVPPSPVHACVAHIADVRRLATICRVLHLPDKQQWHEALSHMIGAATSLSRPSIRTGTAPAARSEDPDGYRVVLQNARGRPELPACGNFLIRRGPSERAPRRCLGDSQ